MSDYRLEVYMIYENHRTTRSEMSNKKWNSFINSLVLKEKKYNEIKNKNKKVKKTTRKKGVKKTEN